MLMPGFPKLSQPGLQHAMSSIALIAQVYLAEKPVFLHALKHLSAPDQQRTGQAPCSQRHSVPRCPLPEWRP